jgi:hypothetical protein
MSDFSRRKFLKTGAAALAGITIAPSSILGMSHGHVSPTDKLNLAAVGIGGMGHANINNVKGTENIVALCDVDWKYAKGVFDEFPKAKKYWDYRKMYDEMGKSIDGVIIATADHTHAIITADAMTMGKHVYCQKPLTHSVYESRLLTRLAASTGVVTQMGNQGASGEGTDLVCEWIWNGEIGEVTKVECATDRPIWPPQAQHVKMIFPARDNMPKVALPEVEVHWYDGGMMPERPKGFPEGKQLMGPGGGLTIFHGTKDTLICGCYGEQPFLLSGRVPNAPKVCRRVKCSHEMDWVRACKEDKSNRVMPKADFSESGPMNEMVVMGVLAIRLQGLNKTLEWDGANMCFTNIGDNETLRTCIKDGFTIHDGHPSFNKTWTDPINAKQFAAELVKHNYREGWRLPDMPR